MPDHDVRDYDLFARLYDLEHQHLAEDIALYRNLAARCGGPVLELGCGAGRVTLALAGAGFDVTGVDRSPAMLALAAERAAQAGLAGRVRLEQVDVRAPEMAAFAGQFALALFPLNGFLHLLTAGDQQAALDNVHRALMPGGVLAVDLPNPHIAFAPALDGQLLHRRSFHSAAGRPGHAISSWSVTQTDLAAQTQQVTLLYDEVGEDGTLRRTTVALTLRFVYCYEMVGLLARSGLALDAVYGSYDLDPYQADSPLMLFVAYKPATP